MLSLPKARRRAGVMMFALLLGVISAAVPALADPRSRLEKIEREKAKAQARQEALAAEEKDILARIKIFDARRQRAETKLSGFDERLAVLDEKIADAKDALTRAQARVALLTEDLHDVLEQLDWRMEVFTDRAVAAYIAGPSAYVDSILSSESFSDLVDRYEYYESALNADSEIVGEIQVLRDETENRRELILEKQAEIASAKRELETSRVEIARLRKQQAQVVAAREAAVAEKEAILSRVEGKRREWAALESQLDKDSDRLRALISQAASSTSGPLPTGGGQLLWPAAGSVTSGYGYRTHPIFGDQRLHTGIDIGAPYGAPVVASDGGVVTYAGVMSGYGNVIVVDHGGGLATTYNHLSAFSVGSGQSVGRGEPIGAVGCSGYCTGPHLHFEVRVNGSPVDPMPYLQ
jgi:murein DD-endopeptidase MepM/ murein hydrolase activator NlpD